MLWMAYLLSKLLPLAVLPLGLSLILLLVGLIGRWRWPVLTALSLLWVFSLGLVSQGLWRWLEAPWQRRAATVAPRADAIVVLSGGRHPAPGAARVSEWEDPDRFLAGLDLYRAGKALRLLFTGGASPFRPGQPPEGPRYLQEARQLGIPAAVKCPHPAGHQCLPHALRPATVRAAGPQGAVVSGGLSGPRPLGRPPLA